MIDFNGKTYSCNVEMTVDLIGGKWKPLILWNLMDSTLRFNELKRRIPGITQKMLTQQLKDLEEAGLESLAIYLCPLTQSSKRIEPSPIATNLSLLQASEAIVISVCTSVQLIPSSDNTILSLYLPVIAA